MPPPAVGGHLAGISVPPFFTQLLQNRGVSDPAQVDPFLKVDDRLLNDPFLLPDIDKAVTRLQQALLSGEHVAVYGDFDADGMTATAVLVQGLSRLGATATPYIPHRVEEGYGLNNSALKRLSSQGVSLVITVDCGISNAPEVEAARSMGVDVIVTDHHTVPPHLPPAAAVVDPKRADSRYPFPRLAGVGVAFKLLEALFISLGHNSDMHDFLDLAALGTVADMEPLLGDNRYLVKHGLDVLRDSSRLGLQEMARCAGIPLASVDTEAISWTLGPRLNAAGRVEHALVGYEILLTESPDEAQRLAAILESRNAERQKITEAVLEKARRKLEAKGTDSLLLVVGDDDFHSGVLGVVAGRLADAWHRPVVVYEKGSKWSRASARSIPEFDVVAAFTDCTDILHRYGGHPMAAGCTVATERLPEFEERLLAIAESQLSSLDLRRTIAIDADVPLSCLNGDTFGMLQKLAPFGSANPYPTFITRNVAVKHRRNVGVNGRHLKFKFKDGNAVWDGIGFRMGSLAGEVTSRLDIVYNLEVDQWRGDEILHLNVLDFAAVS